MRLGRVAYRAKQFACAFTTRMLPQERADLESLLSPDELKLFYDMNKPALRHSLRVFRRLRLSGCKDRDVLVAALIHDVGKGRVGIAHRVAVVLLQTAAPRLIPRISSAAGPRWRRGFHEHYHHPELGAEMARRAGSPSRVVELIRSHHAVGRSVPSGLEALRKADEGS